MDHMTDLSEHLLLKLQRLDLLLHREILRLRATYELSLDEFRGLYISDEQVNRLIDRAMGVPEETYAVDELTQRAEMLREADSEPARENRLWTHLAGEFSLSPTEQDILLLALAPDVNLKYETLYAYLNNDVTRKWPTRDLALRLFATDAQQKSRVRSCLTPDSTLFSSGILQLIPANTSQPSWLANGFSISPSVLHYLSGMYEVHSDSASTIKHTAPTVEWSDVPITPTQRATLGRVANLALPHQPFPLIVFTGRDGTGRGRAAEAVCHQLGIALLRVDLAALRAAAETFEKALNEVLLEKRLKNTGMYLERVETLLDERGEPLADSKRAIASLAQSQTPIFIACESIMRWQELLAGQRVISFHFDDPDYATRLQLWKRTLADNNVKAFGLKLEALADRFILTPGQIGCAVRAALDHQVLNADLTGGNGAPALSAETLFAAARAQSDQNLGTLAQKVRPIHDWEDLVLPRVTLARVKEIAAAIKCLHIVYSDWGFERRIESGKGLKMLFAGPSGTGKTMTAGVIARDIGLDLYKIDLSSIVSKYIGETEKNLERIFRTAECSNAILFFDEADALFGKRSEVRDAHDRYANIEVAYLLQKIEAYEGIVILASNLSKNIDEAFSRRMHYAVEFPLPDEGYRERLWRGMFPPQIPLGADVDFQFLASRFAIPGGDIRNVALDAAFLAAQDGGVVTMNQLTKAMARQMLKQGKIPSATDFKQYHSLIVDGV